MSLKESVCNDRTGTLIIGINHEKEQEKGFIFRRFVVDLDGE